MEPGHVTSVQYGCPFDCRQRVLREILLAILDRRALSPKTLEEEVARLKYKTLRSRYKFGLILLYSYPYTNLTSQLHMYNVSLV